MQTGLLDRRRTWESRTQPADAMIEWIEVYYNRQPRHSTLGDKPCRQKKDLPDRTHSLTTKPRMSTQRRKFN